MNSTLEVSTVIATENASETSEPLSARNPLPDLDALARSRLLLLDVLKEGVYQVDENGLCVFMNRSAGQMLGYEVGEAKGQSIHDLHHCCDGHLSLIHI